MHLQCILWQPWPECYCKERLDRIQSSFAWPMSVPISAACMHGLKSRTNGCLSLVCPDDSDVDNHDDEEDDGASCSGAICKIEDIFSIVRYVFFCFFYETSLLLYFD
jgi:hypothetical protein